MIVNIEVLSTDRYEFTNSEKNISIENIRSAGKNTDGMSG